MTFRKEFKIPVTTYEIKLLQLRLMEKGMKKLYPSRVVQSCYFDNNNFNAFFDSEEGTVPRKKIRFRFYPKTEENINLEIKISSIEGRYKTAYKISKDNFNNLLKKGYVDNLYGICFPKVNVVYNRSYFIFNDVRITFDKNIHFFKEKKNNIFRESKEVIEIKAPPNCFDDIVQDILPIPTSRFSKYEKAIQRIYKL